MPVTSPTILPRCKSAFLLALLGILNSVSLAREPAKGVSRIPRPTVVHATRALEAQLAEWDRQQRKEARSCNEDMASAREQPNIKGLYEITYRVLLDTPQIFSVKIDMDIYCGGAHPVFSHGGVMFDPKSGQQLNPFQMFDIATKAEYGYALKPAIKDILRHAMLSKMSKEHLSEGCTEVLNRESFDYLDSSSDAVLGKDGLHIMFPAAHVSRFCYSEVIMTNGQLRKLRFAATRQ